MIGYILRFGGKEFKIGPEKEFPYLVTLASNIARGNFVIERYACLKLREGLEFEVEVAEFDEPSPVSRDDYVQGPPPELTPEELLERKLKQFRELEVVLKKEGYIE